MVGVYAYGCSFFALMTHRFGGHGLYILDEPEAALSPTRQLAMIVRMRQLIEARSQFIIATHSPILMAYPDARIYQIDDEGIRITTFEDTDHYKIMRQFLINPSIYKPPI